MADTELSPERESRMLSLIHECEDSADHRAARFRMDAQEDPELTISRVGAATRAEEEAELFRGIATRLSTHDRLLRENAELRAAVVSAVESIDMAFAEIGTPHRSHPLACAFEKLLSVSPRKTALTSGPSNAK